MCTKYLKLSFCISIVVSFFFCSNHQSISWFWPVSFWNWYWFFSGLDILIEEHLCIRNGFKSVYPKLSVDLVDWECMMKKIWRKKQGHRHISACCFCMSYRSKKNQITWKTKYFNYLAQRKTGSMERTYLKAPQDL